jgi:hypothetical protein
MYDLVYLCMLIVFSLHRESLKLILVDEPPSTRWFYHSWYQSNLDATLQVPINHNYILSVRIA